MSNFRSALQSARTRLRQARDNGGLTEWLIQLSMLAGWACITQGVYLLSGKHAAIWWISSGVALLVGALVFVKALSAPSQRPDS